MVLNIFAVSANFSKKIIRNEASDKQAGKLFWEIFEFDAAVLDPFKIEVDVLVKEHRVDIPDHILNWM